MLNCPTQLMYHSIYLGICLCPLSNSTPTKDPVHCCSITFWIIKNFKSPILVPLDLLIVALDFASTLVLFSSFLVSLSFPGFSPHSSAFSVSSCPIPLTCCSLVTKYDHLGTLCSECFRDVTWSHIRHIAQDVNKLCISELTVTYTREQIKPLTQL